MSCISSISHEEIIKDYLRGVKCSQHNIIPLQPVAMSVLILGKEMAESMLEIDSTI